jgi:hypothetical protein
MANKHDLNCDCSYCRLLNSPDSDDGPLETLPQACAEMGGVSHMFLRRRIKDPACVFPPLVRIGRRVFLRKRLRELWVKSPHARLTTAFNAPPDVA